eukprot:1342315-Amorphochlora_amoeboformis.AAC.1
MRALRPRKRKRGKRGSLSKSKRASLMREREREREKQRRESDEREKRGERINSQTSMGISIIHCEVGDALESFPRVFFKTRSPF